MIDPASDSGVALVAPIVYLGGLACIFLIATFYFFRKKSRVERSLEETTEVSLSKEPQGESTDAPILLKDILKNTRQGILGKIQNVFSGKKDINAQDLSQLEEILYGSDLGPKTVDRLMTAVAEKIKQQPTVDLEIVKSAIREEMNLIFSMVQSPKSPGEAKPMVWLVVGVNGVGKTTTIGKLARMFSEEGKKVLVAAGDTFRAAAREQLAAGTTRAEVVIHSPEGVSDPAAVAFEACEIAKSQGFGVVIIDTAGRLHTKSNLMDELKKVKRVIAKSIPEAPHETLMVIDANTGQNAFHQTKSFHEALGITGVILTKLDGTAKGGVALGLACELGIPIRWIGIGEKVQDLKVFSSTEFINSII